MKRVLQALVASVLLGSLTIQADPFKTWSWIDPTEYENGQLIPGGDLTNTTMHCGMQAGGPYPASQVFAMQTPPSIEDMAFVVAGLPGTYYCVATVSSIQHGTVSGNSNEINFTVLPGTLGFVPLPPVLSLQ
jgi:hypothetical protein